MKYFRKNSSMYETDNEMTKYRLVKGIFYGKLPTAWETLENGDRQCLIEDYTEITKNEAFMEML